MEIRDVSLPECYLESQDFRFFVDWFATALEKTRYDHEHFLDLFDPLRCPEWLLWMLSDSMGYRYDGRLPAAFCRLVLMYFMQMIHLKGSKDGVTLAAEVNLAEFNVLQYGMEKDILYNRLEDTSVPVNSVYVTPYVDKGYFDVVYFATERPIDACIEYVRPLGMYAFQHAGVRFDASAEIAVDARLANASDLGVAIGPTRVAHYSREDYARTQKMSNEPEQSPNDSHTRRLAWQHNSDAEEQTINPGLRAMSSLQLSNNDHMFRSLLKPIFDLGYEPQDDSQESQDRLEQSDKFLDNDGNPKWWNLRYDKERDEFVSSELKVVDTVVGSTASKPRVAPVMSVLGDAVAVPKLDSREQFVVRKSDNDGGTVTSIEDL